MRRLEPVAVLNDYITKEVKALRQVFLTEYNGVRCGCIIGAVFATKEEIHGPLENRPLSTTLEERANAAGLSWQYIRGIEEGFDGELLRYDDYSFPDVVQGHKDGKEVFAMLEQCGLVVNR